MVSQFPAAVPAAIPIHKNSSAAPHLPSQKNRLTLINSPLLPILFGIVYAEGTSSHSRLEQYLRA